MLFLFVINMIIMKIVQMSAFKIFHYFTLSHIEIALTFGASELQLPKRLQSIKLWII